MQTEDKPTTTIQRIVGGSFGAFCSILATHPLDSIKVRLQSAAVGQKINLNVRSLYNGLLPPLLGILPVGGLSFFGYDMGLRIHDEMNSQNQILKYTMCGSLSALFASVIVVPGERIKVLLQSPPENILKNNKNSFGFWLSHIYKSSGFKGLYTGAAITMIRDVPGYIVWFSTYEISKQLLHERLDKDQQKQPSITTILLSGVIAGQTTLLLFPLDLIKTQVQTSPVRLSISQVVQSVFKEQGIRGFYRGYLPAAIRAIPSNSISWLGTELAIKYLKSL